MESVATNANGSKGGDVLNDDDREFNLLNDLSGRSWPAPELRKLVVYKARNTTNRAPKLDAVWNRCLYVWYFVERITPLDDDEKDDFERGIVRSELCAECFEIA